MQNAKNLAIGSLICGIAGVTLSFFGFTALISLALGVVAVILAVKASKDEASKNMAIAGLILGVIAVVFGGIGTICWICVACAVGNAANELNALANEINSLYY